MFKGIAKCLDVVNEKPFIAQHYSGDDVKYYDRISLLQHSERNWYYFKVPKKLRNITLDVDQIREILLAFCGVYESFDGIDSMFDVIANETPSITKKQLYKGIKWNIGF